MATVKDEKRLNRETSDISGNDSAQHVEKARNDVTRLPGIQEGHKFDAALDLLGTERVSMTDEQENRQVYYAAPNV
ncbi:MAG: hypothetical protein TREMPRED_005551, partial [Tremellales sp. Tagirdzhanova-0007]